MLPTDAVADFIRAQQPYAFCLICIAEKLHLSEKVVRETLQVVGLQSGFGFNRRLCYACTQVVWLIEVAPAS